MRHSNVLTHLHGVHLALYLNNAVVAIINVHGLVELSLVDLYGSIVLMVLLMKQYNAVDVSTFGHSMELATIISTHNSPFVAIQLSFRRFSGFELSGFSRRFRWCSL